VAKAWDRAIAVGVGVAWLLAAPPGSEATDRLDPRYLELLRSYARGDRPQAIAGLAKWGERALQEQVGVVQDARLAAERCPKCTNPLAGVPLRAAVMLHTDRDRVERPEPNGREEIPRCPGANARVARRYATILARDPETQDFARRFFLATALVWQHGACFEDAELQAHAGLELFPRDAKLLLAAGSALEERAALTTASVRQDGVLVQKEWLKEARSAFTEAVARDPDLVLARVRLGRVLWRLREPVLASEALEEAVARARDSDHRFLAHLFLGRVHEDAQRLDRALVEYRTAVEVDPDSQSAAVALSHALQLMGEPEESRRALSRGLVDHRNTRDAYWDYLVSNTEEGQGLLAILHREAHE
jgi:tetratricopeptide (TPR) repeat protein